MPAAGELRCVDAAFESVLEDIDSAFILKDEHRTSEATPKHRANPYRPGALFIFITACVAVVDGQWGTFNNVIVCFPAQYARVKRKKIDSTSKRSLHGARQPWRSAVLQPPV
ncbi:unnamed protein product [Pleuronectes platessa]|uniref:Uncharacterized protein n=1 Tax=Pleuronectes platessa TaxID=8262 RepID=A0A9N7THV2_PLEPL|nr:unnamed protein product [Pleuronectes platessa]